MKLKLIYSFLFFSIGLLTGCGSSMIESLQRVPTAIGSINQIVVICDEHIWDGPIGDTFRFKFESAYPLLPAPEPLFDLKYYAPSQMITRPLRKELRTYLYLADLNNSESPTTKEVLNDLGSELPYKVKADSDHVSMTAKDKWAQGQLIVYVFGLGPENLTQNISKSFYPITKRINQFDATQVDAYAYLNGQNQFLNERLQEKFGLYFKVPGDYVKAMEDENTLWMRKDEGVTISNIICRRIAYNHEKQLTKEGIKSLINEAGKELVTSDTPGSYLVINDEDLPMFIYFTELDNAYTIEARGIWELTYDYMGGPFLAYLIKHPSKNELFLIDGFVYAPGKKKRNMMQQMEHIISSLQFTQ